MAKKTQNRKIKHNVRSKGKRQIWNFFRLSSSVCTVEWKYLYLRWIVGDIFLCLCGLRKEEKIRGNLCRLQSAVCRKRHAIIERLSLTLRQTAKMKRFPSVVSSLNCRVKIFVFVVNRRRHFSIFMWFN